MVRRVSRRWVSGALALLALGSPALANAPSVSLRPQARGAATALGGKAPLPAPEALFSSSGLSGRLGYAVADLQSGRIVESLDGKTPLPPASVAKAVTALYALDALGAEHRFQTRLIATGPVSNGVLQGDLVLAGGGDPTLDTDDLAALARALKQAGVREVQGAFIAWDGALPYVRSIDPEQPDHVGYSPSVSGLALNFNRVHFEWKRAGQGYSLTMDARSDSLRPEVSTARMRLADRDLPVYTYADRDGVDDWTVAASALGNNGSRWLPVRNAGAYAGDVFRTLARSQGIVLKAARATRGTLPGGTVIAQHYSDPLGRILRDMLHFSTNVTAEMVGLAATIARGGSPRDLAASGRAMSSWSATRLGIGSAELVDHSGLGDRSRMAAEDLALALAQVHRQGLLRPILRDFPFRDDRGRVLQNTPLKVAAKTGTLNFVSGLGGYVATQGGRDLAFAIFVADTDQRDRIARADRETPRGARSWNGKAKRLQQALIERWAAAYGG